MQPILALSRCGCGAGGGRMPSRGPAAAAPGHNRRQSRSAAAMYSCDRLAGTWHASGVADGATVEETFVLEGGRQQLDGSCTTTATRCAAGGSVPGRAEKFEIVGLQLVRGGPAIKFTQRYTDGVETQWSALLDADHSVMSSGSWEGFEGSFSCRRVAGDQDRLALTEVNFGGQTLCAMDEAGLLAAGGTRLRRGPSFSGRPRT